MGSKSLKAYCVFEQALDIDTMHWVFTARTNLGIDDYADDAQHLVYVCRWVPVDESKPGDIEPVWRRQTRDGMTQDVNPWVASSLDNMLEKYLEAQEQEEHEFLSNVLTVAIEGGVSYWAGTDQYEPESQEPFAKLVEWDDDGTGISEECNGWGLPDGTECAGHLISLEIIKKGIEVCRITSPANYTGHRIKDAVAEQDAGEIDADAADIIVQFGIFGEIVYG